MNKHRVLEENLMEYVMIRQALFKIVFLIEV